MSDDVRWVVQRREDGLLRSFHGWFRNAEAATRWDSERDALVHAAALATQCVVRAVRRVPAKHLWEQLDHPPSHDPMEPYFRASDGYVWAVRPLPPEPSDRWELVPE